MTATSPALLGHMPSTTGSVCFGAGDREGELRPFLSHAPDHPHRFAVRLASRKELWVGAAVESQDSTGSAGPLALCAAIPWPLVAAHLATVPLLCAPFLDAAEAALSSLKEPGATDPLRVLHSVPLPVLTSATLGAARHRVTEIEVGASARAFFLRALGTANVHTAAHWMASLRAAARHSDDTSAATLLQVPTPTTADVLIVLDLFSRCLEGGQGFASAQWSAGNGAPCLIQLGALRGDGTQALSHQAEGPSTVPEDALALAQAVVAPFLESEVRNVRDMLRAFVPGRR